MDHIHCSGNSVLQSTPECIRQYPHCDSFENDTMSFLIQITSTNAGTEICCQEITFRAPFLKDDPFGAHYHTDGHEKLTGEANLWFRKSFEHILLAEDSEKYRSKCVGLSNGPARHKPCGTGLLPITFKPCRAVPCAKNFYFAMPYAVP
ncbi:hypothetical protein HDU76_011563 [Blyttiomyces sp. JEL0837]|nr:hypothetical protein HDU76_011563 [Blyttiomyces sp. JEL0837]